MTGPCLRADLSITQQVYRGEASFVVKDRGAYFRFDRRSARDALLRRSARAGEIAELANEGLCISAQAVEFRAERRERRLSTERRRAIDAATRASSRRAHKRHPMLFRGGADAVVVGDPDAILTRTMPSSLDVHSLVRVRRLPVWSPRRTGESVDRVCRLSSTIRSEHGLANVKTLWTAAAWCLIQSLATATPASISAAKCELDLCSLLSAGVLTTSDAWSFRDRSARRGSRRRWVDSIRRCERGDRVVGWPLNVDR